MRRFRAVLLLLWTLWWRWLIFVSFGEVLQHELLLGKRHVWLILFAVVNQSYQRFNTIPLAVDSCRLRSFCLTANSIRVTRNVVVLRIASLKNTLDLLWVLSRLRHDSGSLLNPILNMFLRFLNFFAFFSYPYLEVFALDIVGSRRDLLLSVGSLNLAFFISLSVRNGRLSQLHHLRKSLCLNFFEWANSKLV